MSITSEEAAQIKSDHNMLKDQFSQLVSALHDNTSKTGEMLLEMKERDVRDEYKEKEFKELKEAVQATNDRINQYVESKEPYISWVKKKKEFNDNMFNGITSTWGKMVGALVIIAIAAALGLDLSSIVK